MSHGRDADVHAACQGIRPRADHRAADLPTTRTTSRDAALAHHEIHVAPVIALDRDLGRRVSLRHTRPIQIRLAVGRRRSACVAAQHCAHATWTRTRGPAQSSTTVNDTKPDSGTTHPPKPTQHHHQKLTNPASYQPGQLQFA